MDNSRSRRSKGPRYRTPAAAKYLGIADSTLEKKRCTGDGPEFERVGRAVVYSEEALEEYLARGRARSTSEADIRIGRPGRRRGGPPVDPLDPDTGAAPATDAPPPRDGAAKNQLDTRSANRRDPSAGNKNSLDGAR
jgi:hypothetical protein